MIARGDSSAPGGTTLDTRDDSRRRLRAPESERDMITEHDIVDEMEHSFKSRAQELTRQFLDETEDFLAEADTEPFARDLPPSWLRAEIPVGADDSHPSWMAQLERDLGGI